MTFETTRRHILGFGAAGIAAALLAPERLLAAEVPADWRLGVADVEGDVSPRAMTLVEGRAPARLSGVLYRNGPAKFRRAGGAAGHWFDGDGLIRRFAIRDGRASLSARFADTAKRRIESRADAMIVPGFGTPPGVGATLASGDDVNAANTSVMMAGNELWALWEAGSPMRLDPETLASRGFKSFRDDLAHMPFLAHPRNEPDGRVWNLGLSGKHAILWQLAPGGALERTDMIELPRASYIHDFTATARHIVIVLQPWVQVRDALPVIAGLAWQPELGTQVLVIDKNDVTKRRIFELPAFSFFHLADAWEEPDGTIRFDGCIEENPKFGMVAAVDLIAGRYSPAPLPVLAMIALRPDGRAALSPTRIGAEFPRSDARRAGAPRRHTLHAALYGRTRPMARGIAMFDWKSGKDDCFDFGADHLVEEFLFTPRGDGERDGWIIGTSVNLAAKATELHILDAANVAAGPVATWRADLALPVGFHGTFVRDAA
ncbi:MAG: carotenoid oxygenase family protein [Sphingomonas sp.]